MPAETHSISADPDESTPEEVVRRAVFDAISELLPDRSRDIGDETRLVEIGLTDLVLIDLVEWVGREVGERSLAGLEGSELDECETVGDLIAVCAEALGDLSPGSYSARRDTG